MKKLPIIAAVSLTLNECQVEIIANATPKRDYYVVSPEGRRLVQLALGPRTLSFVGASDKESLSRIKELSAQYGQEWPAVWLKERGLVDTICGGRGQVSGAAFDTNSDPAPLRSAGHESDEWYQDSKNEGKDNGY